MPELSLVGAYGSPYSRKMRAVLRYRRIPFRWVLRASPEAKDVPPVPVALIPVLVFPGERGGGPTAMIDSTFQIRRLEEIDGARSVIPPDPAIAFLDALLEDYADEWLTKAMFHYRWAYAEDARKASRVLPLDVALDLAPERHEAAARAFAERQIGRLGVVGSNDATRATIEASYARVLERLAEHLIVRPFLFGDRPASADFALFGQLSQLAHFDPTPSAIAAERAPRVVAWVSRVDDLAWLEPTDAGWAPLEPLPPTLRALLVEVGRTYVPFLLANADALARGADAVTCEIDGAPWRQRPFPYQGKCLRSLRERYGALAKGDRARVDALLAGTGCEALFSS